MGFNVDNINTVSLSNHPNYSGGFKGQFLSREDMKSVVEGLTNNDLLNYDVVMNGYTRSVGLLEEIAETVKSVKKVNPDAIYICDPVLGDNDAYYVPESLLETYQKELLPLAFAVTPNYFEVEALTGVRVRNYEDAEKACGILHDYGVKVCVLTGQRISGEDGPQSVLMSVKLYDSSPSFILRSDVKPIPGYFYGCGDLFSALTTCGLYNALRHHKQQGGSSSNLVNTMAQVIEYSTWAMDNVLRTTHAHGMKELRIVESFDIYRALAGHWEAIRNGVKGPTTAVFTNAIASSAASTSNAATELPSLPKKAHLSSAPNENLVAVIVDMDGTLTEAGAIDFVAMYERNGFKRGSGDILEMIANMATEEERAKAMGIVIEEEVKGCDAMVIRSDLYDFIDRLRSTRVRLGLSTRNSAPALEHFMVHAKLPEQTFSPALHRDSLGPVNKPDPEVANHIMREWGIGAPTDSQVVWFIGDSIDDVTCGKLAGCKTCLIRTPFNTNIEGRTDVVDLVVDSLSEWADHVGLEKTAESSQ
jgi:pyridoxal kinase